jgi:hypothetical protein
MRVKIAIGIVCGVSVVIAGLLTVKGFRYSFLTNPKSKETTSTNMLYVSPYKDENTSSVPDSLDSAPINKSRNERIVQTSNSYTQTIFPCEDKNTNTVSDVSVSASDNREEIVKPVFNPASSTSFSKNKEENTEINDFIPVTNNRDKNTELNESVPVTDNKDQDTVLEDSIAVSDNREEIIAPTSNPSSTLSTSLSKCLSKESDDTAPITDSSNENIVQASNYYIQVISSCECENLYAIPNKFIPRTGNQNQNIVPASNPTPLNPLCENLYEIPNKFIPRTNDQNQNIVPASNPRFSSSNEHIYEKLLDKSTPISPTSSTKDTRRFSVSFTSNPLPPLDSKLKFKWRWSWPIKSMPMLEKLKQRLHRRSLNKHRV